MMHAHDTHLCTTTTTGMEVFFSPPPQRTTPHWDAPSALLAFRTEADRDRCRQVLLQQPALGRALDGGAAALQAAAGILEGSGAWLPAVTAAWRTGRLDNFSYLLFCNLAAGRSFNDLAQWPVFPWVLCDYTSAHLDLNDPVGGDCMVVATCTDPRLDVVYCHPLFIVHCASSTMHHPLCIIHCASPTVHHPLCIIQPHMMHDCWCVGSMAMIRNT